MPGNNFRSGAGKLLGAIKSVGRAPAPKKDEPPTAKEINEMYNTMLDCFKLGLTDDQIRNVLREKPGKRAGLMERYDYDNRREYDEAHEVCEDPYYTDTYDISACNEMLLGLDDSFGAQQRKEMLIAQLYAKYGAAVADIARRIGSEVLTEGQIQMLAKMDSDGLAEQKKENGPKRTIF